MCVSKSNNNHKTSYQRAHYYVGPAKFPQITRCRRKVRPDLYYYDPIINKKYSTYESSFKVNDVNDESWNSCGKLDLSSKQSLKHLYDEYCNKPVYAVENYSTITGSNYPDPRKSVETKLLQKFCTESLSDGINNLSNGIEAREFLHPYVTSFQAAYQDLTESKLHGIARNDTITYYNSINRYKAEPNLKTYTVIPRVFIKVPFGGETSNYRESFKDPSKKSQFSTGVEVCQIANYFQTAQKEPPQSLGMYFTEQMLTGSGKPTQTTI
ncbi:hypothetical protein QAD02_022730 [Eretmocerus hayati]|uniref:Uncharacterized protein n=1 Tax=Eretmocerus hayati TaxID=131215 RepID=A0ACC2PVX8_9HYME|nr:hypothetical protein QAD02_022730 [Eretmocerus hayati]